MRKKIATFGMLIMLLASLVGTAGAQDGVTPDPLPEGETSENAPLVFTHPVVKVLSAYFDREKEVTAPAGGETGEIDPAGEGTEGDLVEGDGKILDEGVTGTVGEQIAALHEEGMGFGVLVKLFAMAEAAEMACAKQDAAAECTPVSAGELVSAFQSGTGMGQLFKEYGKPAMLGVGHVKKALKNMETEQPTGEVEGDEVLEDGADEGDGTTLSTVKAKGKDKGKEVKPASGKPVKDKSKAPKGRP